MRVSGTPRVFAAKYLPNLAVKAPPVKARDFRRELSGYSYSPRRIEKGVARNQVRVTALARSSGVEALMADIPAEHETLRDLMKQPGISIGAVLVGLGCSGLLLAAGYLWSMPRSHPETPPAVTAAPLKPSLVEQRLPDFGIAVPRDPIAPQRSEPLVERSIFLPETQPRQPTLAEADVAAAEAASATAPPAEPLPPQPVLSKDPTASDVATPAQAQPAKVALPPLVTGATGYRLQLGAMRTPESAKQEWDRLQQQNRDLLANLTYAAPRVDLGNRGVFYRIQAGRFADAATADRACSELKRRSVGCILVKP